MIARSGWSKQGGFEVYVENTQSGLDLYDHFFEIGEEFNLKPVAQILLKELKVVFYLTEMILIITTILLNVVLINT